MTQPAPRSLQPRLAAHGVHHYENFPVASWLTPARLRPAIVAIYGFARTADDLADEGDAPPAQRLADLAAFRADLMRCGETLSLNCTDIELSERWPQVFAPLHAAIQRHALPLHLLDDLLLAFEQDVRYTAAGRWYANEDELLDYSHRSADPVGRLLLHLYGVAGEDALAASDAICSALQLINFWQDPSRDIAQHRYYIPLAEMAAHGVQTAQILAQVDTPNTMHLIANLVDSARARMRKGLKLPVWVRQQVKGFDGWRLSLELRCVMQGGLRILEKIQQLNFRTLNQRPRLQPWDAAVIVWRALWM